MEKYYTPKINEFKIDFVYEIFQLTEWRKMIPRTEFNYEWKELNFNTSKSLSFITKMIKQSKIRVKYLDESDLLSLGWTHLESIKDPFYGKKCVYSLTKEVGINTGVIYYVYLYPKGVIYLKWKTFSSYQKYEGELQVCLKNKSEFKTFFNQLMIM